MAYIFDGYCYPDAVTVMTAQLSAPVVTSSFGVTQLTGANMFHGGIPITFTSVFTPFSGSPVTTTFNQLYSSCTTVGPLSTSTGLNSSDSVVLCFAIITVWAVAWAVKILRRTLLLRIFIYILSFSPCLALHG